MNSSCGQPTSAELEAQHEERIHNVVEEMQAKSRISIAGRELTEVYLTYLQEQGGKDAMKKFLAVDRDMFG